CSHCTPGNRLGFDKTILCVNPLPDLPLLNPARDLSILCLPSSTVCSVLPPAVRHWRQSLSQLGSLGGRDLVSGCVKSIPTIRGPGEG
ncbi:unnamed protein product, partial [Staurois parvus]